MSDSTVDMAENPKGHDWAGEMGQRWLANLERFETMIEPVGRAVIERAGFAAGARVLDIGSGGGATSLEIARRVGPSGSVLGLDISPDLVAAATRRAAALGLENLSFVKDDAARGAAPGAPFDRLFSRFGIMFFEEPYGAFANLRKMLRPGGRADFAVWAAPRDNAWMMDMLGVVRGHIDVPRTEPRTPGPFALEDVDYLRDLLTSGGFTGIEIDRWSGEQMVGGAGATPEEATDFALNSLALSELLDEQDAAVRERIATDMIDMYRRHHRPEGVVMTGTAWLVTARG